MKKDVTTYQMTENAHSGLELELHFMPRFFVGNPGAMAPHVHRFYQIIWFRRGHGVHRVDFVDYPVADNTIFFIAPGQAHSFDGTRDYEGIIIHFNDSFMADEESSESVFLKYDVFNAYDALPYYRVTHEEAARLMETCKPAQHPAVEKLLHVMDAGLALAERRGRHHTLRPGIRRGEREDYRRRLRELGLGLEDRLTTKVGTLSGGQRQALTLLMATLQKPKLLLLDEHTAALDPQTAQRVMDITDRLVRENHLTTLMITHNMRDAIHYGNRLLMLHNGRIVLDISGEEKARLTVPDLLALFSKVSGQEYDNDRALLA